MTDLSGTVAYLRRWREGLAREIERLDEAIAAIEALETTDGGVICPCCGELKQPVIAVADLAHLVNAAAMGA